MWQKRVNLVVATLTALLFIAVLLPYLQRQIELARRVQSKNNLKQIGLALHNYESTHSVFPPGGVFGLEHQSLHGWMTFFLPYMDDSPLFNTINLSEPWNSVHNAGKVLNRARFYENPSQPVTERFWEFPVAHYGGNSHMMAVNSSVTYQSIKDKTRTFFAGELAGQFLPWACPYNWRHLDGIAAKPLVFGWRNHRSCCFVFADGHVGEVANNVSKDVLEIMRGPDLSGFGANVLNIQTPSTFTCPVEAEFWSFSYGDGVRTEIVRNHRGEILSKKRMTGK